ncbi:MAG: ATP-binding protein, partial [Minicystis sp.]
VAGWPIPMWLWLPYTALMFDHQSTRLAVGILLLWGLALNVFALLDGVLWIFPLLSTAFAVYCSWITKTRYGVIHGMLEAGDEQHEAFTRALATLNESQARLASLVEHTDDVVCSMDRKLKLLTVNSAFRSLIVWLRGVEPEVGSLMLDNVIPERQGLWEGRFDAVLKGEHIQVEHAFVIGERSRVLEISLNPIFGAGGAVTGITLFGHDISTRKEAEQKAAIMQRQLLDVSRKAGMAEVATSVLHNIGNVLNSVNVSASVAMNRVRRSKGTGLAKAVDLLRQHEADLPGFFAMDPRARRLPEFLGVLNTTLEAERRQIGDEMESLQKNIDHIKVIVSLQQSHAKSGGIIESLHVGDLLDDTLALDVISDARHGVEIVRDYEALQAVEVDRHKLMQILVNLLSNARHAVRDQPPLGRRITLGLRRGLDEGFTIEVADSGYGILAQDLPKIFTHGFTTKKEGHGFGLHASACAAEEMGGQLTVESPGAGQGTTFTLRLPGDAGPRSRREPEVVAHLGHRASRSARAAPKSAAPPGAP